MKTFTKLMNDDQDDVLFGSLSGLSNFLGWHTYLVRGSFVLILFFDFAFLKSDFYVLAIFAYFVTSWFVFSDYNEKYDKREELENVKE
jgi:phage shock protein PspC (stress-responsive transcriptional regulator)